VVLKGNHCIIGISNQQASATEPRSHHALEPFVQHMVQVNVREQWRDHAALGRCATTLLSGFSLSPPYTPFTP
jgi:hypothetical protein